MNSSDRLIANVAAMAKFLDRDQSVDRFVALCKGATEGKQLEGKHTRLVAWLLWLYYNSVSGQITDHSSCYLLVVAIRALESQFVFGTHLVVTENAEEWKRLFKEWSPATPLHTTEGGPTGPKKVNAWLGKQYRDAQLTARHKQPTVVADGELVGGVVIATPAAVRGNDTIFGYPFDFVVWDGIPPTLRFKKCVSHIIISEECGTDMLLLLVSLILGRREIPTVAQASSELAQVATPFVVGLS